MATHTPNLNLYMPDSTDDFGEFRAEHNDNMVKIDNAIGGGGGSGGHTIVNPSGTDMPAEGKLQFTGGVTVTDDSVNGKTVVDISGGGGNVYGAFIDTNRLLVSKTTFRGSMSYTATEDCFVVFYIVPTLNDTTRIKIDGNDVSDWWRGTLITDTALIPVKKGQVLSVTNANTSYDSSYFVYGTTQGTNGIFTPIIYSDTERVVGVWRDNKPLYQKTVYAGSLNAGSGVSLAHGIANIDTIANYEGIGFNTVESRWNTLPRVDDDVTYQRGLAVGSSNIVIWGAGNTQAMNNVSVTIWYTKTTDVAGSGNWNTDGVPTVHYSTTEQVIGTWENGKPLYARLINPNITANATASGDIKYGSFALSNFIADVDMAWIDTGMSYYEASGATRGFMSAWYQKDNGLITITTLFERNNVPATIAIKYTKSTD